MVQQERFKECRTEKKGRRKNKKEKGEFEKISLELKRWLEEIAIMAQRKVGEDEV